jgi:hypothetical protein
LCELKAVQWVSAKRECIVFANQLATVDEEQDQGKVVAKKQKHTTAGIR